MVMTNEEIQDYKIAAEKLLNSMGKIMALKYYGYDGKYKIKDINVYEDGFVELEVSTDKPVPDIMDVKIEPNFVYGKYASASDLIGNLESQLRYLGNNKVSVLIVDDEPLYHRPISLEGHEFKENPEKFIHLCNGSVVEKSSGFTYPLYQSGIIAVDEPYHLSSIDNEEWWESLCDDDKIELNKTYS